MARSFRNSWVVALAGMSSALAAQDAGRALPLDFDAQSFVIDRKTNLVRMQQPRIAQGSLTIQADEALATGLEIAAGSELRFSGNVRITVNGTEIRAASAVFTFGQERLARGELAGGATFTATRPDNQTPVRGGAESLVYDDGKRTLELMGTAWIHKDQYEIQGCDLVYDFKDERIASGDASCSEGFRVRVLSASQSAADASPAQ